MVDKIKAEPCKINRSEVVAVMKSSGVAQWVAEVGVNLRVEANKAARSHTLTFGDGSTDAVVAADGEPYRFRFAKGRFDTLGVVEPATYEGVLDENQNHTLESLNH